MKSDSLALEGRRATFQKDLLKNDLESTEIIYNSARQQIGGVIAQPTAAPREARKAYYMNARAPNKEASKFFCSVSIRSWLYGMYTRVRCFLATAACTVVAGFVCFSSSHYAQ